MNVFGLGPLELILILVVALIVFGPGRLPEIGAALGRGIREFRKATNELTQEVTREIGNLEAEPRKQLPKENEEASSGRTASK